MELMQRNMDYQFTLNTGEVVRVTYLSTTNKCQYYVKLNNVNTLISPENVTDIVLCIGGAPVVFKAATSSVIKEGVVWYPYYYIQLDHGSVNGTYIGRRGDSYIFLTSNCNDPFPISLNQITKVRVGKRVCPYYSSSHIVWDE